MRAERAGALLAALAMLGGIATPATAHTTHHKRQHHAKKHKKKHPKKKQGSGAVKGLTVTVTPPTRPTVTVDPQITRVDYAPTWALVTFSVSPGAPQGNITPVVDGQGYSCAPAVGGTITSAGCPVNFGALGTYTLGAVYWANGLPVPEWCGSCGSLEASSESATVTLGPLPITTQATESVESFAQPIKACTPAVIEAGTCKRLIVGALHFGWTVTPTGGNARDVIEAPTCELQGLYADCTPSTYAGTLYQWAQVGTDATGLLRTPELPLEGEGMEQENVFADVLTQALTAPYSVHAEYTGDRRNYAIAEPATNLSLINQSQPLDTPK